MPLAQTFIPDPPPPDHTQAPPSAAHTNLPADESVWTAARRSYVEAGCSSPVVAECHGLNARTVRRRAAEEDWPAERAAFQAAVRRAQVQGGVDDPAQAFIRDMDAVETADLLIDPDGDALVRAAARLAGEAMHRRAPQESLLWMRVAREAERASARIAQARRGPAPEERFRLEYYRGLAHHLAEGGDADPDATAPDSGEA
jgi:hypothetical protein